MDRNRGNFPNRGQRKMNSHVSSEFFALGTKDSKPKMPQVKKREANSSISNPAKKTKLISESNSSSSSSTFSNELWEQMSTNDCESYELVSNFYAACEQQDNETVLRLLCGSIKQITNANARSKNENILYTSLLYLCKNRPEYFCKDLVTSALVSMLRRDPNSKIRPNPQMHVLACNILAKAYADKNQWPDAFLLCFIDDALNERSWVDNPLCSSFCENICAVFKTRTPQTRLLQADPSGSNTSSSSTTAGTSLMLTDEDSTDNIVNSGELLPSTETSSNPFYPTQNRYAENEPLVEKYVLDAVKEALNKRQQQDNYARNMLKFLCTTSGFEEVRHLCIGRLELWIHNAKLVKVAQQLLSHICLNIKCGSIKDYEVLAILVKMRLKTKPLINFYMLCLKEMITIQPDILRVVLKLVVQNELSNTRNPNNMGMLGE